MTVPAPAASSRARRVLTVCTGNICRSPYAHLLLAHLAPSLSVSSAGVGALEGSGMNPLMAEHLGAHGVDHAAFTAHQVTAADLEADLILVMSLRQRSYLLEEFPAAVTRIGLLGAATSLPSLVRADIAAWSRREGINPDAQIPDPYLRGPEAAARAAALIDTPVRHLARLAEATGSASASVPGTHPAPGTPATPAGASPRVAAPTTSANPPAMPTTGTTPISGLEPRA